MSLTGIYKRKDGRWEARLRVDNKENGKRIIKSFYGKTAIDVQKKMYTYKRSVLYDEKTDYFALRKAPFRLKESSRAQQGKR